MAPGRREAHPLVVDIRTRLVFALVAVSLGSMFVLGAVVVPRVDGYIRDGTLQQLDELAEAKRETLRWIIAGWRDGADLVASRTQLRASLEEHERRGGSAPIDRMRTILNDAISASRSLTLLEVFDVEGNPVAAWPSADEWSGACWRCSTPTSWSR